LPFVKYALFPAPRLNALPTPMLETLAKLNDAVPLIKVYVPSAVLELSPSRSLTLNPPKVTLDPFTVKVLVSENTKSAPAAKLRLPAMDPSPPKAPAAATETVPVPVCPPLMIRVPALTVVSPV